MDVPGQGLVAVHLPARWSLCKAPPVEVEGLEVGMRVRVVGEAEAEGEGALRVCTDAEHQVLKL